jgi:hypothetical protein
MSKTLLIYDRAVPVTRKQHGNWGVKVGSNFSFARDVNSMPLLAQEFRSAVREYPIVFVGTEERVLPAVLLALGDDENLFVDDAGVWNSQYIPAFARRYPYVFSSTDEGKTLTLCLDEDFSGFNRDGEGERLFTEDGEQTPYMQGVLAFQKEYKQNFDRTAMFCKNLQELHLLDPMQAQLKLSNGKETSITGFMTVNRDRLKEVSAERLSQLARVDELELIYLHLQSLRNITDLGNRIKPASGEVTPALEKDDEADQATHDTSTNVVEGTAKKKKAPGKKKSASAERKTEEKAS